MVLNGDAEAIKKLTIFLSLHLLPAPPANAGITPLKVVILTI